MNDNLNNENLNNNNPDFSGEFTSSIEESIKKDISYFKWGLTAFLTIMAVTISYLLIVNMGLVLNALGELLSILMPVIDGFVISYLLSPIINKFENYIYSKKSFSEKAKKRIRIINIIVVLSIFIFIIYMLFSLIIPEITENIFSIKDHSSEYAENVDNLVNRFYQKNPEMGKYIDQFWTDYSEKIFEWVNSNVVPKISNALMSLTSGILSAVKALFNLAIGIIISVYFMYNKEMYIGQSKKIIYALFKTDFANVFIHNARFTNKTFNGFIVGKVIDSIIIGMICYIITTIIGTPYPLLISIIVGITNIIPFFGPFIGAIPCTLLILFINPKHCIYFIIMIIVLQQFDGNVLGPKILGDSTGLQGFWVIFAITLFGGLWGVFGMFIGVPLFAVIYSGIRAFIIAKLEAKGLKTETSKYISVDYINDDKEFIKIPKDQIVGVTSKKQINRNPISAIKDKLNNDEK